MLLRQTYGRISSYYFSIVIQNAIFFICCSQLLLLFLSFVCVCVSVWFCRPSVSHTIYSCQQKLSLWSTIWTKITKYVFGIEAKVYTTLYLWEIFWAAKVPSHKNPCQNKNAPPQIVFCGFSFIFCQDESKKKKRKIKCTLIPFWHFMFVPSIIYLTFVASVFFCIVFTPISLIATQTQ